jgi:hypothetical protein
LWQQQSFDPWLIPCKGKGVCRILVQQDGSKKTMALQQDHDNSSKIKPYHYNPQIMMV